MSKDLKERYALCIIVSPIDLISLFVPSHTQDRNKAGMPRSYVRFTIAKHLFSPAEQEFADDSYLSVSQLSRKGFKHGSFWSCSRPYSSESESRPSLSLSKCPNIHLTSLWQPIGKWPEIIDIYMYTHLISDSYII